MHNLRVGVIVDFEVKKETGGTYSYYKTLLNGIDNYQFHPSIEIVFIALPDTQISKLSLQKEIIYINGNLSSTVKKKVAKNFSRYFSFLLKNIITRYLYKKIREKNAKAISSRLEEARIDILYYLKPNHTILDIPYIITHWDLAHKSTYPFPETSMYGNYENRDAYHSSILNKALAILCESEASIKELTTLCSINPKKLELFPIFGSEAFDLPVTDGDILANLQKFNLVKDNFFLYPAQFWSLKNHYNLILAFNGFLKNNLQHKNFKLVLCGSDKGNMEYIRRVIDDLELKESVIITGFIENEELDSLYRSASALVFPSLLGPTNMPLIEAAKLGCPVLCSDLEGHREILGNHAIYFDPIDQQGIINAMEKITNSADFRKSLINAAQNHIQESKFNLQNSLYLLNNVLIKIMAVRKTWGLKSKMNANA